MACQPRLWDFLFPVTSPKRTKKFTATTIDKNYSTTIGLAFCAMQSLTSLAAAAGPIIYSQDFSSFTPGRVTDNPPGSPLPRTMSDPNNWYTESDGNTLFFLPGAALAGAHGTSFLWGTDGPGTGLDKTFISDPISVVSGEMYTLSADVAFANNGNNPVFSASYSNDGATWNSIGTNFQPTNQLQWQTGIYTFTAVSTAIQFKISNATVGGVGNDGGISWVRLEGLAGTGDISSYPGVVPEPSSLILAVLSVGGILTRRRRSIAA